MNWRHDASGTPAEVVLAMRSQVEDTKQKAGLSDLATKMMDSQLQALEQCAAWLEERRHTITVEAVGNVGLDPVGASGILTITVGAA